MSGTSGISLDVEALKLLMEQAFNSKSEEEVRKDVLPTFEVKMGSLQGMADKLASSTTNGPTEDSVEGRIASHGENRIPQDPPDSILALMFEAAKDPTMIILLCAAVAQLIIGTIPAIAEHPDTDWIEGAAILLTCFIVCLVAALNDWQKDKQFRKLNETKDDILVNVIRDGTAKQTSVYKICVGDLVLLEVGDILCADGVCVKSHSLKINESTLTGESNDLLKQKDYEFVGNKMIACPFLFSGTQVMEGNGVMLVTCVGVNSIAGNISKVLSETEKKETILQDKLDGMAALVAKMGLAVAVLILITLWIIVVTDYFTNCDKSVFEGHKNFCEDSEKGGKMAKFAYKDMLSAFITAITLLVVAIPEGLPLAVTITMAYSVMKMFRENNLVRYLGACETMGGATTICSDKTGTLTTNRMTVMKSWIGSTMYEQAVPDPATINKKLQGVLFHSIAFNSTGRIDEDDSKGPPKHVGNKTECSLLAFVNALGGNYEQIRRSLSPEQEDKKEIKSFSSARKAMSTLVPTGVDSYRLFNKGAAEVVLDRCAMVLNPQGDAVPLVAEEKERLKTDVIKYFAQQGLRCLAIAFKDFDTRPDLQDDWVSAEADVTLIALVGIEDPVRDEVPRAIDICRTAGITVRMVTGDNIDTARSIARKCGILPPDGGVRHKYEIMEGPVFRAMCVEENGDLKQDQIDLVWPHLRVLARSSPTDKFSLVSGIKMSAVSDLQVVAVTGDGTNDGPALKQADVGFAMGMTGTAIAKEASDIVLVDDNFYSIVNAVKWGRNVYDNVGKFLQFQLTVNVVAVCICFVTAAVDKGAVLSTVQMLWVNLIMDSMAALALATEPPTDMLLNRRPYARNKSLLSRLQLRFIFGHSIYQLTLAFCLLYYFQPYVCEHPDTFKDVKYGPNCMEMNQTLGEMYLPQKLWASHCEGGLPCKWHENIFWTTDGLGKGGSRKDKCMKMCKNPAYFPDFEKMETLQIANTTVKQYMQEESGDGDGTDSRRFKTLYFNTFVFCQIFNEINARKLNGEINVFDKLFANNVFSAVIVITIVVQICMVQLLPLSSKGGTALQVMQIDVNFWIISVCLGALELPWNLALHFFWPKFLLVEPIGSSHGSKVAPGEGSQ